MSRASVFALVAPNTPLKPEHFAQGASCLVFSRLPT